MNLIRIIKPLFLVFLVCCFCGCNQTTDPSSRFELLPEPDKDLREAYEANLDVEYLGEQLYPIRKRVNAIEEIEVWTNIAFEDVQIDERPGKAAAYYLKDTLTKIETSFNQPDFDLQQAFYIDQLQLILVVETRTDWKEREVHPNQYVPDVDTFFFANDSVIRMISNKDCGAPFAQEYLDVETTRIRAGLLQIQQVIAKNKAN